MKYFYFIFVVIAILQLVKCDTSSGGEIPSYILAPLAQLQNITISFDISSDESPTSQQSATFCQVCNITVGVIIAAYNVGASKAALTELVFGICTKFQPAYVCNGIINLNLDTILYILKSKPNMTSSLACTYLFQSSNCGGEQLPDFRIDINSTNKSIFEQRFYRKHAEIVEKFAASENLVIVQITDTHYDPHYLVGGNAVCDTFTCCRSDQNGTDIEANKAGKWGDYRDCDSPWEAIFDMFVHINQTHKHIDYIYFTGDTVDHGMWATSLQQNLESFRKTLGTILDIFPNIPLYPIIGNHEPNPVNQISPSYVAQSFGTISLYEEINSFVQWLPTSVRGTIDAGGYYTVVVRPGFRIIALNNNLCYTYNFWLLYDSQFPKTQLEWLYATLLLAEQRGEVVHILAHIPTGDTDYWYVCSREYRKIVERFAHVISTQFNGHTHRDQFSVYYSLENPNKPINVAWNGGSATAFSNVNVNYRVYEVEPEFYQIAKHETWIFNMTEANLPNNWPRWVKEYNFQDAFGVINFSPIEIDNLLTNMATNPALLQTYFEYYVKQGDPSLAQGCDNNCLVGLLCEITQTSYGADPFKCNELSAIFWDSVNNI